MSDVIVREFQPSDADAFFELNREWIQRYFWLEPADLEVLWHPQTAILDCGGRILMAVRSGVCVGCCALIAIGPGEYELAKMAVTPAERRHGIRIDGLPPPAAGARHALALCPCRRLHGADGRTGDARASHFGDKLRPAFRLVTLRSLAFISLLCDGRSYPV
jgi:hypothetical protein